MRPLSKSHHIEPISDNEPAGAAADAQPTRSVVAKFEHSAALGISLLVAASFALQSLVIAHGHVSGKGSGHAEASLSALGELPEAARKPLGLAPQPVVTRNDTTGAMLALGSGLRSSAATIGAAVAEAAGETIVAKTPAGAQVGLRIDTFGPEVGKSPRIRTAMLGPAALGNAPVPRPAVTRSDADQEVIVIRPGGPRTLNLTGRNTASDSTRAAADAPRILGKATPQDIGQLVDKVHFQPHTPERCLPHNLLDVVYDVAEKFGEVQILSTFRDRERNRRVGGAEQSFHLSCQAIDFRVTGGSQAGLLAYLEGRPEVGGLKRYPLGYFHIDNGARRSW